MGDIRLVVKLVLSFFILLVLSYRSIPQARLFFSAKFDCRLSVLSRTACACCRKIFLSDMSKSVFFASSLPGLAANPVGRKNNQPFGTGGIKGKINKILILKFEAI